MLVLTSKNEIIDTNVNKIAYFFSLKDSTIFRWDLIIFSPTIWVKRFLFLRKINKLILQFVYESILEKPYR